MRHLSDRHSSGEGGASSCPVSTSTPQASRIQNHFLEISATRSRSSPHRGYHHQGFLRAAGAMPERVAACANHIAPRMLTTKCRPAVPADPTRAGKNRPAIITPMPPASWWSPGTTPATGPWIRWPYRDSHNAMYHQYGHTLQQLPYHGADPAHRAQRSQQQYGPHHRGIRRVSGTSHPHSF